MFARILKRLFGNRKAERVSAPARPVSPPPPAAPTSGGGLVAGPTATMPPPPPPPPPATPVSAPVSTEPALAGPPAVGVTHTESELEPPQASAGTVDEANARGSAPTAPESLAEPQEVATSVPEGVASPGGRVKLILDDGTLATPALDEELEERLRYIVDNIVPPPEQPST